MASDKKEKSVTAVPKTIKGVDEAGMWMALGPLQKHEHERSGVLYELIYRSGSDYAERALDVLAGLASLHIIQYCPNLPSECIDDILLRHDNPAILKTLVQASKFKPKEATPEEMAKHNMHIYRTSFPDAPVRLAKLYIILVATQGVPAFTARIKERTFEGSWNRLYMLLFLKLDAFKAGREKGVRGRQMLSDSRGVKRNKTSASASASEAAAAVASASAPVRAFRPAYCGFADAVIDMCMLYEA